MPAKKKTPKTAAPLFGERELEKPSLELETFLIEKCVKMKPRILIVDIIPIVAIRFPAVQNPTRTILWWYDNKYRKELEKFTK